MTPNIGIVWTDKAQKYYEKTLEIDPDNVVALNNLANILLDQGKEDEALKYLKYTTQMHPDYAEAWINLGLINELLLSTGNE